MTTDPALRALLRIGKLGTLSVHSTDLRPVESSVSGSMKIIPGAGHSAHVEKPEETAMLVVDFVMK